MSLSSGHCKLGQDGHLTETRAFRSSLEFENEVKTHRLLVWRWLQEKYANSRTVILWEERMGYKAGAEKEEEIKDRVLTFIPSICFYLKIQL